jgi:hypothetical protein
MKARILLAVLLVIISPYTYVALGAFVFGVILGKVIP